MSTVKQTSIMPEVIGIALAVVIITAVAWAGRHPVPARTKHIDLSSENIGKHTGKASVGFVKGFLKGVKDKVTE